MPIDVEDAPRAPPGYAGAGTGELGCPLPDERPPAEASGPVATTDRYAEGPPSAGRDGPDPPDDVTETGRAAALPVDTAPPITELGGPRIDTGGRPTPGIATPGSAIDGNVTPGTDSPGNESEPSETAGPARGATVIDGSCTAGTETVGTETEGTEIVGRATWVRAACVVRAEAW